MANELTMSFSFAFTKSSTTLGFNVTNSQVTVTGTNGIHHRQAIGTSEETVTLGDVAAGGYMIVVNRDATNFVKLRPGTGVADLIRLKAGEAAMFRLDSGATLYAIADTAACEIEYVVLDD